MTFRMKYAPYAERHPEPQRRRRISSHDHRILRSFAALRMTFRINTRPVRNVTLSRNDGEGSQVTTSHFEILRCAQDDVPHEIRALCGLAYRPKSKPTNTVWE